MVGSIYSAYQQQLPVQKSLSAGATNGTNNNEPNKQAVNNESAQVNKTAGVNPAESDPVLSVGNSEARNNQISDNGFSARSESRGTELDITV